MSAYKLTPEFKENISFLESKLLSVIDNLSLTHKINSNRKFSDDSRFIKCPDHTRISTGTTVLDIDDDSFLASTSGNFYPKSQDILINSYRFSSIKMYNSNQYNEYKNNNFFKFTRSLTNGSDFFIYLEHFLSFSKKFFNEIDFTIDVLVNDNLEIKSINIRFFQDFNIIQNSSRQCSSILYDSYLWNAYNMDNIENMFNLIELDLCSEIFEDFIDIMGNPEADDMLKNFSAHKESYIALAEINAV